MKYAPAISLGLSLILGLTAFFILRASPAEGGTDAAPMPAQVNAQAPDMVEVYFVSTDILAGAPVTPDLLAPRDWPASALTGDLVTDAHQLRGSDGQPLLAQTDLTPGQPLLVSAIGPERPRLMLSRQIPEGYRAVSISVTTETGVAGFVLPGDRVDLTAFHEVPGRAGPEAFRPEALIPNALVLGVDQVMGTAVEGALPVSLVTLALKPDDAAKVAAVARNSRIGLTLLGQAEADEASSEADSEAKAPVPAPAPRRSVRAAAPAPTPRRTQVKVIHGNAQTTVTAPVEREVSETSGAGS